MRYASLLSLLLAVPPLIYYVTRVRPRLKSLSDSTQQATDSPDGPSLARVLFTMAALLTPLELFTVGLSIYVMLKA